MVSRVPPPLLRNEPIQEVGVAECAKGGLGRFVVAAERLACPQRQSCGRLAAGARKRSAGGVEGIATDVRLRRASRDSKKDAQGRSTSVLGRSASMTTLFR